MTPIMGRSVVLSDNSPSAKPYPFNLRVVEKPRIYWYAEGWCCRSNGRSAWGTTPLQAWAQWAKRAIKK